MSKEGKNGDLSRILAEFFWTAYRLISSPPYLVCRVFHIGYVRKMRSRSGTISFFNAKLQNAIFSHLFFMKSLWSRISY